MVARFLRASGFVGGDGTVGAPYQIQNVDQLQAMWDNLSAHYVLINDIDASGTVNWDNDAGFEPIGNLSDPFNGTFDGNGYIISDLLINRTSTNYVGLFGSTSGTFEIKKIGLVDVDVSGTRYVGALVGDNYGPLTNPMLPGNVSGYRGGGGLVIVNNGTTSTQSHWDTQTSNQIT